MQIIQREYHRNGICGMPFHAFLFFDDPEETGRPELFVGIQFADDFDASGNLQSINPHTAVLRVRDLSTEAGVTFGINSWRGDRYTDAFADAIKQANA